MSTIDTIKVTEQPRPRTLSAHRLMAPARHIVSVLAWLLERRRTRMQLLELTDDQLKDIGLSRADAYHEGNRTFFDRLPATGSRSWFGQ